MKQELINMIQRMCHCSVGDVCSLCRSGSEAGQTFRQRLRVAVPELPYRFLCPLGKGSVEGTLSQSHQESLNNDAVLLLMQRLDCAGGAHCRTCRDKEGGRGWREELKATIPDLDLCDFPCPLGKSWGHDPWKDLPFHESYRQEGAGRKIRNLPVCPFRGGLLAEREIPCCGGGVRIEQLFQCTHKGAPLTVSGKICQGCRVPLTGGKTDGKT